MDGHTWETHLKELENDPEITFKRIAPYFCMVSFDRDVGFNSKLENIFKNICDSLDQYFDHLAWFKVDVAKQARVPVENGQTVKANIITLKVWTDLTDENKGLQTSFLVLDKSDVYRDAFFDYVIQRFMTLFGYFLISKVDHDLPQLEVVKHG